MEFRLILAKLTVTMVKLVRVHLYRRWLILSKLHNILHIQEYIHLQNQENLQLGHPKCWQCLLLDIL